MRHLLCLVLIALVGCAPTAPVVRQAAMAEPFDAAAHARFAQVGDGRVAGQAFLRQRGGGVVTCAGAAVMLWPDTAYFRKLAVSAKAGLVPAAEQRQQMRPMMRATKCDAQGRFEISGLPNERWILMTTVAWSAGGYTQGGAMLRKAETGQTDLLMTETDRIE